MKEFIDIGVNLLSKQFETDREAVIIRAKEAGVCPMVVTGTSVRDSTQAAAFAERYPGVLYSTAGVHPHDAKSCNDKTIGTLRELLKKPQVVSVGECGLDYDRDFSPRDVQRTWFEAQLCLAEELDMPLFLHERAAFSDFVEILKRHPKVLPRAVVHCFTGTGKELQTYLSMGMYIGITGWICDERRGETLRQIARLIPLSRLMIETDAPFLLPRNRGIKAKRNEPQFLPYVLREAARCIGKKEEAVAEATVKNSQEFFGIK